MCLLIYSWRPGADHPLVVAANRDEWVERPAEAFGVLQGAGPRILGGRDLMAGGTWLAVNEHGLVAGLTNRPSAGGRDDSKRSRGELPLIATGQPDAEAAVAALMAAVRPVHSTRRPCSSPIAPTSSPSSWRPINRWSSPRSAPDSMFSRTSPTAGRPPRSIWSRRRWLTVVTRGTTPGRSWLITRSPPRTRHRRTAAARWLRRRATSKGREAGTHGGPVAPTTAATTTTGLRVLADGTVVRPGRHLRLLRPPRRVRHPVQRPHPGPEGDGPIDILAADGPPCVTPFEDRTALWEPVVDA